MRDTLTSFVSLFSLPKLFIILLLFVLIITLNLSYPAHNQFSLLTQSFIQGKANIILELSNEYMGDFFMHDEAFYRGNYFWPLGPLPSVLLIPFVLMLPASIQAPTAQGILNVTLIIGIIYLLWGFIAPVFSDKRNRITLLVAFIAGSPLLYIALIPKSWFIAQSLTTFLTLLALREYFTKRRFWLIGLIYGLILATRVTAAIGILFFFLAIMVVHKKNIRSIFKHCVVMGIPVFVVGIMLCIYNYVRFDSPLEQGYRYQMVATQLVARMNQGVFSLRHAPENLYYLLLAPPLPTQHNRFYPISADPWGMSVFITSPYLLWLIVNPPRAQHARIMLVTSVGIMLPIMFYYGIGFYQFGYRYVLDCFPFLFAGFLLTYKQHYQNITEPMEHLIFVSAFVNLYFVVTLL